MSDVCCCPFDGLVCNRFDEKSGYSRCIVADKSGKPRFVCSRFEKKRAVFVDGNPFLEELNPP